MFYDCDVKANLIKKSSLCFRKVKSAVLLQSFSVPALERVTWCFRCTTRHAAASWPDLGAHCEALGEC